MAVPQQYQADVEAILARRHDNGGDLRATADGRLGVGGAFSTLASALVLSEVGMDTSDPVLKRTANAAWGLTLGPGAEAISLKNGPYLVDI